MTALSNVVIVNISRQTAAVARASFGVPAIIAEFATTKTTVAFDRYRYYGSLTEAATDGWADGDAVYDALSKVFGQKQTPTSVMVGRIDSTDASVTAALNAIQVATNNWYGFGLAGITSGVLTLSTDLITGNSIASTINGVTVAPVVYATSHADTMTAWETAIESAIPGATATAVGAVMTVALAGTDISPVSAVVTLGASQPTVTASYVTDSTDSLAAAAWASTQVKIFGHADANVATLDPSSTTDLGYVFKGLSYDRTFTIYHALPHEYAQFAWLGLELPKDPGQSCWATKTLQGVTPDVISEGAFTALSDKNVASYTTIGGVSVTLYGVVASGEAIEVIRNVDYCASEIQADQYALQVQRDIIPGNDSGVGLKENTLRGTLSRMEVEGVLQPNSSVVTVDKWADISAADKAARSLPMAFESGIQNAIVKTVINGVVTL